MIRSLAPFPAVEDRLFDAVVEAICNHDVAGRSLQRSTPFQRILCGVCIADLNGFGQCLIDIYDVWNI
jgi:hypothetical protein